MSIRVSAELLSKYDRPGPRYTSYPTAPTWSDDFDGEAHRQSLLRAADEAGKPMSMYVHVPYCESMCFYCGCSTVITQDHEKGRLYVEQLLREAELARAALGGERTVVQHHWGGGTPTFLPPETCERLFSGLAALFPHSGDAEISIEVDPRVTSMEHLDALRRCGFNRISMGVQDLDVRVQETIHRVQPFEQTKALVEGARERGFLSVNLDLVYGLPYQNVASFEDTIGRILELRPDRLACYGYAHVPWLKKHQQVIPEEALPRGRDKLDLYLAALSMFEAAGYVAIGMDHFALPDDGLVAAARDGSLHRNFMGYTTQAAEDMVAFGVTSISEIAGSFAQNKKITKEWAADIDRGVLPVERGLRRSADDERRRRIILDLMCRFRLSYDDHGGRTAFQGAYEGAMEQLRAMAGDGLVELDEGGIRVTRLGRLFVRNICMPFDAYLGQQRAESRPMFSRTV